jgi:hypothetical protein
MIEEMACQIGEHRQPAEKADLTYADAADQSAELKPFRVGHGSRLRPQGWLTNGTTAAGQISIAAMLVCGRRGRHGTLLRRGGNISGWLPSFAASIRLPD